MSRDPVPELAVPGQAPPKLDYVTIPRRPPALAIPPAMWEKLGLAVAELALRVVAARGGRAKAIAGTLADLLAGWRAL